MKIIIILALLVTLNQKSIICEDLPVALPFQNGSGTSVDLSSLTVRGILKHIHQFNRELIGQVLESMSHDPNSPLSSIMPEASRIILATHDRLGQCYDSSIGDSDELLNIFNQPLGAIVLKFVNSYKSSLIDHTFVQFKSRIKTLLSNIVFLAGQVLKCALNSDPNYEPTRLGLTPFALYTHAEFLAQFSGNSLLAQNDTEIEDDDDDDEQEENVEDLSSNRLGLGLFHFRKRNLIRSHRCNVDSTKLKGITSFDWRDKGVVTEVRHQDGCRSCYIFSAVGTMESAYMIQVDNSSLVRFSEQQFVDCIDGCKGGFAPRVWNSAIRDGLVLADKYPRKYVAKTLDCKLNDVKPVFANLVDYCQNTGLSKDEQLMAMIYQFGPTAIAIDAHSNSLQYLKNGTWNEPCGREVNHAVIAVGWNEKYWIIKNSWGSWWGIKGYLHLPKRQTDICGIYNQAGVPFFHKQK